jgi:hypothetical protein
LPENFTIDGRGDSIHDAITEMWSRMRPLELRGYNPISGVEIVDVATKEIIQTFQISDPEFQLHLKSDEKNQNQYDSQRPTGNVHAPERKEHYKYVARVRLG